MSEQREVVTIEQHGEAAVLRVETGQLTNIQTVDTFSSRLTEIVASLESRQCIVDFNRVTFIVTPAVNALLKANRQLNERGGRLVVVGLNENIRRVFQLMKLDRVLTLAEDVEAARACLADATSDGT